MKRHVLFLVCLLWTVSASAQDMPPCKAGDMRIRLDAFMVTMDADRVEIENSTCYFTGSIVVYYPDDWAGHVSISEHLFGDDLRLRAYTFSVTTGAETMLQRLVLARGVKDSGWRLDSGGDRVTFRPRSMLPEPKSRPPRKQPPAPVSPSSTS